MLKVKNQRKNFHRAEMLTNIILELTANPDLENILDSILNYVHQIIAFRSANIAVLRKGRLESIRWRGYQQYKSDQVIAKLKQPLTQFPLDAKIIRQKKPVLIKDTHKQAQWVTMKDTQWIRSSLAIPITTGNYVYGLLRLDSDKPNTYTSADVDVLKPLVNAAAIALEKAKLYQKLEDHSKNLEQIVKKRSQKLLTLVNYHKEFLSLVGHELRTPLAIIKATAETELFKKKPLGKNAFNAINTKVDQITQIIKNLLLLSRLETTSEPIHRNPIDLKELLKEVAFESVSQYTKPIDQISLTFGSTAPKKIVTDYSKLSQILGNLISNAIKFSPQNSQVTVKVMGTPSHVSISILDEATVINPSHYQDLFKLYYREKNKKGTVQGHGLGLTVCKQLVNMLGGKISIKPRRDNSGNIFTVTLTK